IRAVDKLSDAVDEATRASAEQHLIELAAIYDPKDLQVLGTKILEVVAPDIAEAELGKQLEREEQAARDEVAIRIRKRGNGITRWICDLPDAVSERALTYLEAEDSPRVTRARSRGEAFCRLLENLDPNRLPDHGGDATTVIVTIPFEALIQEMGSAALGSTVISASEARRLARAPRRSSPSSSAARARSSTSAEHGGSTRHRSARPCGCGTSAAAPRVVRSPQPGVRLII
ncbi:MAG TPA: DUF222 domain-containing protein, partial [Nocardioides sp.]|nr:DUF222 domain-containing protein [Nocardioides sp.]